MMKMRNSVASGRRVRKVENWLCVTGYELGSFNSVPFAVKFDIKYFWLLQGHNVLLQAPGFHR